MKKLICLTLAVVLLLLSGCSAGNENSRPEYISDQYAYLYGIKGTLDRCHAIAVVEAVESEIEDWKPLKSFFSHREWIPCTVSTVVVKQSLRGSYQEGDTVTTIQRGDGVTVAYSSIDELGGYMQPGKKYLLFLGSFNDTDEVKGQWEACRDEPMPCYVPLGFGQCEVDNDGNLLEPAWGLEYLFGEKPTVSGIQQQLQEYAQNQ